MAQFETHLQFRSDCIIEYTQPTVRRKPEKNELDNLDKGREAYHLETISTKSIKRLHKAAEIWSIKIQSQNLQQRADVKPKDLRRLVFLTLTLPSEQRHSDKTIKRNCLQEFLRILSERYKCDRYIWRAEVQQNGNIHFHILVDRFVHKGMVRKIWNRLVNTLGYVDRFEQKHKKKNPPSTQIEAPRNLQEIVAYTEKYMSKVEPAPRPIDGRVWGCSNNLKELEYYTVLAAINESFREYAVPEVWEFMKIIKDAGLVSRCLQMNDYVTIYSLNQDIVTILQQMKIPLSMRALEYYCYSILN